MLKKVSHVDQAVITRALLASAHEMGAKLIRSAHSPIVREAQDCSAALLDRRGNVVAQSELIALQLGSITHTFRPCLVDKADVVLYGLAVRNLDRVSDDNRCLGLLALQRLELVPLL